MVIPDDAPTVIAPSGSCRKLLDVARRVAKLDAEAR
jgi:hypothetical protein